MSGSSNQAQMQVGRAQIAANGFPAMGRPIIPNYDERPRNLLAQGYRPVMSADGSAVYLVQVARSVRGGLSFTF